MNFPRSDNNSNNLSKYSSFSKYSNEEKKELWNFFLLLANATYGTFKDVPLDNRIPPQDYLKYVNLLRGNTTYIISNSHVEIFSSFDLLPTITELGFCLSYNGEIGRYNDYKLVVTLKI